MSGDRPPVLLLGSGLTVLGALRLLNRAGCDPVVLAGDAGIATRSRHYRAAPRSSGSTPAEVDLPAYLEQLPLSRAVLLPCSDAWMLRVARCAAVVAPRFPSAVSAAAVLEQLIDKWSLARLLVELDLPHPRTIGLEPGEPLPPLDEIPMDRAFIKPRDSAPFFARFGTKGIKVASRAELIRQLERIAPSGLAVQLQEYVPGPSTNHFYVEGYIDRTAELRSLFVRQRGRMYPPDFGNSTSFESVAPAVVPDAVETVARLLAHVRFRGIFSVELKRDARDGICKLIEINARPWWYVEFAGQCGANVLGHYVRDALGQPDTSDPGYEVGKRCVYPYYDYFACRELHARHELSLAAWARSWLTATQPVFRWSDPVPAVSASATLVRDKITRAFSGRSREVAAAGRGA